MPVQAHTRRFSPALRLGLGLLLAVAACGPVPLQQTRGPEIVEQERQEEVKEEGSLQLILEEEPSGPPGKIRGRVTRPTTCQTVAYRDVTRTDQVQGRQGANVAYLLTGLALSAGGIALLATTPDAFYPPRRAVGGVLILLPGLGLAGTGGYRLVRGRKRQVTERYTAEEILEGPAPCEARPVEGATVFLTAADLEIGRSPVAVTGEDGTFELTLLGPREGLRPFHSLSETERQAINDHGINFAADPGVKVRLVLDVSMDPDPSPEEDLDEPEEEDERDEEPELEEDGDGEDAEVVVTDWVPLVLGDWITEPARRAQAACLMPSSHTLCLAALEDLKTEHTSYKGALTLVETSALQSAKTSLGNYDGSLRSGLRHGQGTVTFPDGRRYEGGWKNGRYHGQGTFDYGNGDRYRGQWKDGRRHGRGVYSDPHGMRYEGQWKDGDRHGQGHLVYPKDHPRGQVEYWGEFSRGDASGKGKAVYPGFRYEGQWSRGRLHGKGTQRLKSGLVVKATFRQGEWAKGKHAVFRWPTGLVWEGKWTPAMDRGTYRFENVKRRSANLLYVQAGRLLDEGEDLLAQAILRHIADKHPSSAAARRAVDRLASLREREELEARQAKQLRAVEKAEANRLWDERANRLREEARQRQAHDDARRTCLAGCEGKSHKGLSTEYNRCVMRCP